MADTLKPQDFPNQSETDASVPIDESVIKPVIDRLIDKTLDKTLEWENDATSSTSENSWLTEYNNCRFHVFQHHNYGNVVFTWNDQKGNCLSTVLNENMEPDGKETLRLIDVLNEMYPKAEIQAISVAIDILDNN